MNRLVAILPLEQIVVDADITSKKRAFEELGFLFENLQGINRTTVTASLLARERLGSTGLGHGVAIPHGRTSALPGAVGAFLRLAEPIDFSALDGQPVDLVFALAVPEHFSHQHLLLLSQLAEMFSDAAFCARLRTAPDNGALYALLADWQLAHAAA